MQDSPRQTTDRPTSTALPRILLVDDDRRFLETLCRGLGLRYFEVKGVESPGEALPLLEEAWPEVLVLDVAMPGIDGISFCRLARRKFTLPILMLTARDEVESRIAGLDAGADDYMAKPFSLDELELRLRGLLRRANGAPLRRRLHYADLILDEKDWTVTRAGREITLTAVEFRLLGTFMQTPETVLTRGELLERSWGVTAGVESNVVDVHVGHLRRKLEANGRAPLLHTVRRAGYKLEAQPVT